MHHVLAKFINLALVVVRDVDDLVGVELGLRSSCAPVLLGELFVRLP
jgi:hypothetical protein